ncbi:hypothetical protein JR316_0008323 [Psilocybe cubensis]|uniref:BTB domain-containing protein n=2 Tax=Psilocybe cubensis TaxID=181762 RepID=A0A8H8CII1_PSICU|nr:hypothetical protein JR316_0008323 [Psilocybe cubensis]KAH9479728.1 hypothetical protein JR316_0008323 [Psilocybe cubensis]
MGPYQTSARKRRRTQGAEQEESFEVIKSERFWFEDGSVVLQVANTQFRVHRSTLARHSSVLRDMFSKQKPQKSKVEILVEGCPVVVLADRPEDIEHLLSIFYESIRVHDLRDQMDIEYISAILRLGKKYDIEYLKEEGLRRLQSEFPLTLEDWDCRNERKNKGF